MESGYGRMIRGKCMGVLPRLMALAALWAALLALAGCGPEEPVTTSALPPSEALETHCRQNVGPPRVERISEHVWAAIGYDLANVLLVNTPVGNVIIDAGMSPARARPMRQALLEASPGPIAALVYTHSHIDHVGGASVWAGPDTPIWATEALPAHLLKQYQVFLPIEALRGGRQFGRHATLADLPCSGLGRRADIDAARDTGVLLPTRTFSGSRELDFGGFKIVLNEAPGETHDHLFVWVPADRTIIAGDDFYWNFPNLYTIRGASPRPVDKWIESLDKMRRLGAEHLIGCHNIPLHGAQPVAEALTDYRDAIQWVRDAVVRAANQGRTQDEIAEAAGLPPHLAAKPWLQETYGQVDWSARAIYTNNLGWFDGRADRLYPVPAAEAARREVELMGGPERLLELARQAGEQGQTRWAVHLLAKLRDSGLLAGDKRLDEALAKAYRALAAQQINTNGRGYLLERAYELTNGPTLWERGKLNPELAHSMPLDHILTVMAARLEPDKAMEDHESLKFRFPDVGETYTLIIRHGVCEVSRGQAPPWAPAPLGEVTMTADDFRRMALGLEGPLSLYKNDRIAVSGGWLGVLNFMRKFEREG